MVNTIMIKNFRKDFEESMKELEKKYGVTIHMGSTSYDETHFTSKLEVKVAGEEGKEAERKEFETYAKLYGFEPSDYEREFILQGIVFKLVGFNHRSPKNNCSIIDVKTGKKYKCSDKAINFSN